MLQNLALSESGFLFDTRTGVSYSLSPTGTHALQALIAGCPADALPQRMCDRYEVQPEVARRDIERFLFRLRDMGLLPNEDAQDIAA